MNPGVLIVVAVGAVAALLGGKSSSKKPQAPAPGPAPRAPSAPSAPRAPSAPSAPRAPSAPSAPSAPAPAAPVWINGYPRERDLPSNAQALFSLFMTTDPATQAQFDELRRTMAAKAAEWAADFPVAANSVAQRAAALEAKHPEFASGAVTADPDWHQV